METACEVPGRTANVRVTRGTVRSKRQLDASLVHVEHAGRWECIILYYNYKTNRWACDVTFPMGQESI